MPSSSSFSLPLRSGRVPDLDGNPKKRKRDNRDVDDDSGREQPGFIDDSSHKAGATAPTSPSQRLAKSAPSGDGPIPMTPSDAHQYRIAGQNFDEPLPEGNFPHRPLRSVSEPPETETDLEKRDIRAELASLNPPLYVPNRSGIRSAGKPISTRENGLRRQHLGVLTTLLNLLLCEGDFVRASRAFGLLIRSQGVGGADVDVRKQGYWGIGAEILFRRNLPVARKEETQISKDHFEDEDNHQNKAFQKAFDKDGFAKAKDYYERLILQYPYRKTAPHTTSALDFYPPMFGLWIYATQQEFLIARKTMEEESQESEEPDREESDDANEDEKGAWSPMRHVRNENQQYEQREDIRKRELQQAEEIAARLDELLLSPPYSDSVQLRQLQTMLALWVKDLAVSEIPPVHGSEDEQEGGKLNWSS